MEDSIITASRGVATRHERIAEAARQLAGILAKNPELADELTEVLLSTRKNGNSQMGGLALPHSIGAVVPRPIFPAEPNEDKTNVGRLVRFFVENGNKAIPTPEIGKLSGMDQDVAANVLWSLKGRRIFVRQNHPDYKKIKLWRLTDDEFSQQKSRLEKK